MPCTGDDRAVRALRLAATLAVGLALGGCKSKVTYYCSTCLADQGCVYCSPRTKAEDEAAAKKQSREQLCEALAGVSVAGAPAQDKAACLASPAKRFVTRCKSIRALEPDVPIKVELERSGEDELAAAEPDDRGGQP